jgi:hypothetical protein
LQVYLIAFQPGHPHHGGVRVSDRTRHRRTGRLHRRAYSAGDNTSPVVVGVSAQLHLVKVGVVYAPERVDLAEDLGHDFVGPCVVGSRVDLGGCQVVAVTLTHDCDVSRLQMRGYGFQVELIGFDPGFASHSVLSIRWPNAYIEPRTR